MTAGLVRADGVARATPSATAPIGDVITGMVALGHRMCAHATSVNWVASPLSIACAFAMARVGARGAAAGALDEFFGYPADGRDEAFNAITQALVTASGPPSQRPTATPSPGAAPAPPVVALGNALFAQQDFALQPPFLRTLAAQYGAGVRTVDFRARAAVKAINQWVSQETAGRIPVLFNQLDESTKLVVANTVYLRASWQSPFVRSPTTREPFARAAGGPVQVAMMHAVGSQGYAAGPGWQALSLPYAGPGTQPLAMWLLLPAPGGRPADLLAPTTLRTVGAGLHSTPVDVAVPKWDFSTAIDLGEELPALGLDGVFGTGDFSGIATQFDGVSAAVHRATITVDEYGTEAAAATGLVFATSAMQPPATTFHANRPFAFTIVGGPAHTPLFSGVVGDPGA
ncbi:MAG TPA: serpin family protein [Micromonosporaceae bacterium]